MQNIINIVFILGLIYVIFRLPSLEQMTNIDTATENKIREIYKIDTDAIRNLSNLARNLTVDGKLVVPGGLEVKGNLKVEGSTETANQTKTKDLIIDKGSDKFGGGMTVYGGKDEPFYINYFTNDNRNERKGYVMLGNGNSSNVLFSGNNTINGNLTVENNAEIKKQITIHELYGGKSNFHGWRDIQVNGGHIKFNVGNKSYGFHSNDNGLHYYINTDSHPLNIYNGIRTNVIHMGSNRIRNLGTRIGFRMSHPNGCCNNPRLEPREFSIDYDWQNMSSLRYWAWRDNGTNERGRVAQDGHTWDVLHT